MALIRQQSFSKWREFPIWLLVLGIIALLNFVVYWLIAVSSGGDAWNGYIKDGRFFLGSHGRYTEVSSSFWTYSYYHTILVWVTHATTFGGLAIFLNHKRKKKNVSL